MVNAPYPSGGGITSFLVTYSAFQTLILVMLLLLLLLMMMMIGLPYAGFPHKASMKALCILTNTSNSSQNGDYIA